ncbi:MAG: radical SAM protein, partial [Bacteroidales bacterium]|nr:radical SAM protein [Bacteroidales bacterium]
KVRITGGEPLERKGVVHLTEMLSAIKGIKELTMTTNGTLLAEFATSLKKAGLNRVNISMDTADPVRYREITRGGDIKALIKGILTARDAGLEPVKLNCVINSTHPQYDSDSEQINTILPQERDAVSVAEFAQKHGLQVRFIPLMDLCRGEFGQVIGGDGGNCKICNRLRLTATGILKPCLFSDIGYDINELGAEKAICSALNHKPERGGNNTSGAFYNIGG